MTSIFLLLATATGGQETKSEPVGKVDAPVVEMKMPGIEVDMLAVKPRVDLDTAIADLADIAVDISAVGSLRLPPAMTLTRLVRRLEEQLAGIDRPLLIERRWMLVENYYRYRDGRQELVFLDSARTNLKRVYLLNHRLAGKGEISDTQLFSSHNSYLRCELEYLATEQTVRGAILEIVRLANLELTLDTEN